MDAGGGAEWQAQRAADFLAVYRTLPPAGSPSYWWRLDNTTAEAVLPLEVLASCLRERYDTGHLADAHRVFVLVVGRIQRQVAAWSATVASLSAAGAGQLVQDDLAQECYTALWHALTAVDISLWAVAFRAKLASLQSHTAHACMERWGLWKRSGVARPTRVPAQMVRSLDAPAESGSSLPLADQIEDPHALPRLEQAEYGELRALVQQLDPAKRAVVYARYWQGMSPQEIARSLGVRPRTIRWREQHALSQLRAGLKQEEGSV